MKLVYKATGKPVKLGDRHIVGDQRLVICFFARPSSPASEGKICFRAHGNPNEGPTYYASVIGAEWIEREDRAERADALAPVPRYSIDLEGDDGVRVSLRNVPDRATTSAQEYALALMRAPGDWRITGTDREAARD